MKTIPITPIDEVPGTCSSSELLALQVLDDSMAPEFNPGHVVVIDSTARLQAGVFVLLVVQGSKPTDRIESSPNNTWLVRRWKPVGDNQVVLEALNPEWPDERLAVSAVQVLGVVVQRAGRRRHERRTYR